MATKSAKRAGSKRVAPAAPAPKKSRVKRKSKRKFLELGTDCLLYFCDGLDIRALSAMAGTCLQMQAIARKSFELKRITACHYEEMSNKASPAHTLAITDPSLMADVLQHFGDYLLKVNVAVDGKSQALLENLIESCGGTLRTLLIRGKRHLTDVLQVDVQPLFESLTDLTITQSSYGILKYPFDVCSQLTSLSINSCDSKTLECCLKANFPQLRRLKLTQSHIPHALFDNFLLSHAELTDLIIISTNFSFDAFSRLTKLENLYLNYTDAMMRQLIARMPLKLLSMSMTRHYDDFVSVLTASSVLRDRIEILRTNVLCSKNEENNAIWSHLALCVKLRELRMNLTWAFTANELVTGLTQLIDQLPDIALVELRCNPYGQAVEMDDFQMNVRKGIIKFRNRYNHKRILVAFVVYFEKFNGQ